MSRDTTASDDIVVETAIYRAALGQLRPLTMCSKTFDKGHILAWRECRIQDEVIKVLERHGLQEPPTIDGIRPYMDAEASHVRVLNRWTQGDPDSKRPMIRVELEWNDETSFSVWPEALRQVHLAVKEMGLPMPLDIEFIASQLLNPVQIHPIVAEDSTQQSDYLEQAWNGWILDDITRMLRQSPATRNLVNLVTLCRYSDLVLVRVCPITVYVAMHRESKETNWPPVVERLKSYLKRSYHDKIEVRMEHADWTLPQTSLDVRLKWKEDIFTDYHDVANLGAEIGCTGHAGAVPGTLGCYLEVKKNGHWSTVALTTYHVVRPLLAHDDALVHKTDRDGITFEELEEVEPLGTLEHPCQRTYNQTIDRLERIFSKAKAKGHDKPSYFVEPYDASKAFFNEGRHILGSIWAASGSSRRSASGHALDWALIDVRSERRGRNFLPGHDDFKGDLCGWPTRLPWPEHLLDAQPQSGLSSTGPSAAMWRVTAGQPIGGLYSRFHSVCGEGLQDNSQMRPEHMLLPNWWIHGGYWGAKHTEGDSGAVVYTDDGVIAGLVSRGMIPHNYISGPMAFTFVTPIEDVFEDIKALTGAEEIRVLGGQDETGDL